MSKQKWKSDPNLYDCKRDKSNKKNINYYNIYIKEFLSTDPVRDWESIDRCIELWEWTKNFINIDKKMSVLDCGTKDGQFTAWLEKQGYDSIGIEIDDQYVKYAQSKNRNVIKGDICNIKYKAKTFNVTFAHHVMGLVPDYQKSIKEMIRVTKQNGIIIFCNQIPGNPRKHYCLVKSVDELSNMINECQKHKKIFFDYWRKDEHVSILKRA